MRKVIHKIILCARHHLQNATERRNEFKRIVLTIQVILLAILAAIIFAILDFGQKFYMSMAVDLSTVVVFLFCLYLLRKGKFSLSKAILVIYTCLTVLINTSQDGRYAGNEYLWFPILAGIFLFYSSREIRYIILCLIIALSCILFLEITDYSYWIRPIDMQKYKHVNYIIVFSISVLLICLYMYYLIKINADSERKLQRLNQTLVARNEYLKKINSELDSFVYKASHDMRAPLTSLLGLIQISKNITDRNTLKEFSDLQERSIQKLDSYIIDILNISKNSRTEIEIKEINFHKLISDVLEQLQYLEHSSLIRKTVVINQATPFYSDETRLKIIFSNVIANSIRYADTNKAESILNIEINTNSKRADIMIVDNGIGIPSEHLTKIFNMFYRATDHKSGSGLGLYIVRETLQKLKGNVEVLSEHGKYTNIKVTIPNSL